MSASSRFRDLLQATRVYAVTDDQLEPAQLFSATTVLLAAGVRVFQFRDKVRSDAERFELAGRLGEAIHAAAGMLVVNDRVDIAIASRADGAHLGQDDLPLADARTLLGPDRILGASASYLLEIEPACQDGIDYLGFGAVYATETKPDAEFAGLELFTEACRLSTVPVVGIGGITIARAPAVLAAGAVAVATVSALYRALDPGNAARKLLAAGRDQERNEG